MMTRIIAMASAASVPMRGCRWMSAISAVFVRRESIVMILQPRSLAAMIFCHHPIGCAHTFVARIRKTLVSGEGGAPTLGEPKLSSSAMAQP